MEVQEPQSTSKPLNFERSFTQFSPETVEQTGTSKARHLLGEAVKSMDEAQLETMVAQCEYLIDCWLDDYERKVFNGKTLSEMVK